MGFNPIYSLGPGGNSGSVSPSTGRTIFLGDNCVAACMMIETNGGNATVFLECTGGPINNATGEPTSQWIDVTGGSGYALTPSTPVAKDLPPEAPYWRARITSLDPGANVFAYVPGIRAGNGDSLSAQHPTQQSPPQFTGGNQ